MSKRTKKNSKQQADEGASARVPNARLALGVILAGYLLAALGPILIVPYDSALGARLIPPDEPAHWAFVKDLATGRGLPAFTSGESTYEAHQPPLYYLSAIWTYWVAGERGVILARLWSALIGGLTLLVAWRATRFLLGERFWTRLAAVGALAFIPGRLFIVSSVSNDALFELCAATVLWLALRGVTEGIATKEAGLLGLCLGLGLLTKTSCIVLMPVVALALVLEPSWRRVGWKHLLTNAAVVGALVVGIWGWWVARNMMLYGEPLALNVFQSIFLKDRATPEFFLNRGISWSGYWMLVAYQTWLSLWGVFGQATVYMPRLFYCMGAMLAGLAAVGLIARAARSRGADAAGDGLTRLRWALAILLLLFVLATFLRFNTVFYQAQARYLLGASVVLVSLLASGICGLARNEERPWLSLALIVTMAAMSAWAIVAHVTGGYSFLPPGVR